MDEGSLPCDSTVFVVDDDGAIRDAMRLLLTSNGFQVETFSCALDFLESFDPERPCGRCLVLDLRMPGLDGFELQRVISERSYELPIIFISGHGDVPTAVRAIRAGAVEFLEKPFCHQLFLDRVRYALNLSCQRRREDVERRQIAKRLSSLTPREREVMQKVCNGLSGKQIAAEMGVSYKTLEKFRARVMAKMETDSVAELTKIGLLLNLCESPLKSSL